ncbi:MAG: TetR/AcrR family transcriptional regulator [Anaerolineaceae bacterium]
MVRELSDEKRERFLEVALRLFAEKGVQNTSTAEIAQAAGTASGTLFLYFPTKQMLVNELVIHISKGQAERINQLLNPSLSVRDSLYTIWETSIHWFLDNMEVFQFTQQIRGSNLIAEDTIYETGKLFAFYYSTIQRGLDDGCIKPYPVDLIGGFLYQDIMAVMNHMRMPLGPLEQEEAIQQGFDLFWSGIQIQKT